MNDEASLRAAIAALDRLQATLQASLELLRLARLRTTQFRKIVPADPAPPDNRLGH